MRHLLLSVLLVSLVGIFMIPNAFAENVPDWVKNTAGWWASDQIADSAFFQGIQYLIKEGIMVLPPTETSESASSQEVPSWVKNNAGWWADGLIDDSSFVSGIQWLISNGIIVVEEKLIHTDVDFRVAFIGDQGLGPNAIAVLNLIKDEGAQIVLHQGDFDYLDDPDKWDRQISDVLGSDFPYFASIGHHEAEAWNDYQEKLYDRLKKIPDAVCYGDLGVKSNCTYKGLFFILVAPGGYTNDSDYDSFIEKQLNDNDYTWMICSWHNDVDAMQQEAKPNKTGWEVYESCKNGGAIIATAHQHVYTRSKTLIDFENQIVDPDWPGSNKLRVKEGATFTFISGLGGKSIFGVTSDHDWPINHSSDQGASYGALFCTFNVAGQPNKAYCYFKNIDGRIIDEFTITSFLGAHIDKINPTNVDLSGRDLTGNDLSNATIIDTNLSNATLVGADLSNAVLIGTTLTGADLTDANLTGVSLKDKDLTGTILTGADLTDVSLTGVDLSGRKLMGTILRGADLTDANLTGVDLSGRDLTGTLLRGMDLTDKDLTGTILREADLTDANLTGIDLSGRDLTGTILRGADLTDAVLPSGYLSGKNFKYTIFNGVDLSGKYLGESIFNQANFADANLENANLTHSIFVDVDLTNIKNKSLAGANLSEASFAHSDLSGVNLAGVILHSTNFFNANLSGQDFTIIDDVIDGMSFKKANLSNSNFEGVDLSPKEIFFQVFQNIAHLNLIVDLSKDSFVQDIFSGRHNLLIISSEVRGNDLAVDYIFFNSFAQANLENANFKNADLRYVNFYSTNLTNAVLSGADLRKTFLFNADLSNANLSGADLSGADLSGADLSGAFINENTILKCINHPICLDE